MSADEPPTLSEKLEPRTGTKLSGETTSVLPIRYERFIKISNKLGGYIRNLIARVKPILTPVIVLILIIINVVVLIKFSNTVSALVETQSTVVKTSVELQKSKASVEKLANDKLKVESSLEQIKQENTSLKASLQAKKDAQLASIKRTVSNRVLAPIAVITGNKQSWLAASGIPASEWSYVDYIVSRESGWNPNAVNSSSGATGLCQALPAGKMASAGADYMTNPVTQLRWCSAYANSPRYGSWYQAYSFWISHRYW